MYILLIIVLMLSQEASFSSNIHRVAAPPVPWYTERAVGRCSLGSIVVMVLCRTAQSNLFRHNDAYLHTSTLAALTNMAPHMRGMTDVLTHRHSVVDRFSYMVLCVCFHCLCCH